MKKILAALSTAGVLLFSAQAFAIPYSNTVTFSSGNVLSGTGTFTWSHTMPSDFEVPFDQVNSAVLTITSQRAKDSNDEVTVIDFGSLGFLDATGNSQVQSVFDLGTLGVFTAWTAGDALNLKLDYVAEGNASSNSLTMVSSLFCLDYDNLTGPVDPPTAPVPEPGTMVLLGAGFLGLAVYGKRRKA